MAPKIQFSESDKKILIQCFDEISTIENSVFIKDIPALFFEKTNKNVSYRVLKKLYDEIISQPNTSKNTMDSKSLFKTFN